MLVDAEIDGSLVSESRIEEYIKWKLAVSKKRFIYQKHKKNNPMTVKP